MNKLPLARSADIVVQELGNEVLIYDLNTHKAYNLNETSSIVYKACDGKTTFDELKLRTKFTDEIIFLALEELKKENLIQTNDSYISFFAGMSRREVIRKVGFASMIALPVISSLVAPTAAMAQSGGFPPGSRSLHQSCTASSECASGNCFGGSKCCVPGTTLGHAPGTVTACAPAAVCSSGTFNARCCSGATTAGGTGICTSPGEVECRCV